MNTEKEIILLGGEQQAAASFALAYPTQQFVFVSDFEVIDGWDLPNVTIVSSESSFFMDLVNNRGNTFVALSGQMVNRFQELTCPVEYSSLVPVMDRLKDVRPDSVLAVFTSQEQLDKGEWIVKGDRWHKPDQVIVESRDTVATISDDHGCGLLYQSFMKDADSHIVMGLRESDGGCGLGLVRIIREVHACYDQLLAGETIVDQECIALVVELLSAMDYKGFFTFNLIKHEGKWLATSFRPYPRGIFASFVKGGVNFLDTFEGKTVIAAPGVKFIVDINYASYMELKR